ncbi:hypothetical protein GGP41_007424 [Bipolaris sorokiniana]|uniref:Uncharacterized protein n=1 Tax=Cochliobolus sativus TaxID=45130 RepID=A0A8H5ZVI0_COCSA|nr:hypothetical protein GGP41_007424 [Bipolaris sorokiniana]
MVINPTYLAQRTRSSVNWADAKKRVIHSYRDWLRSRGYFEADDWFTTNCGVNKRPEAEGRVGFERSGQQ